jgi:hypothetical protein
LEPRPYFIDFCPSKKGCHILDWGDIIFCPYTEVLGLKKDIQVGYFTDLRGHRYRVFCHKNKKFSLQNQSGFLAHKK